ncbi:MAG TPA: mandelate racemase/muconate lactonizing enzyme family protein [bacterium]|nr:mandelate racemase/muconate lactonizing enzyme family protein [bacterium]
MKIARVEIFGYALHYVHGSYIMSGGRVVTALPSTVVRITADDGLTGWGEVCPLGATYLPAFAEGARAALRELAPAVLGLDPTNLGGVHDAMDATLRGHAYAKSPIDVACWDLFGKSAGCSVATLLGGRRQTRYPLYIAVPLGSADEMADYVRARRAEGVHRFQLKIGGDPYADRDRVERVLGATDGADIVVADANGGWTLQDAIVAARLLTPLPRLYLEQPCATLEECLHVRRHTTLPMILDEVITDVPSFLRAAGAGGMEAINLKIAKVGGLARARLIRDLAESLGIRVTIEDMWGGDIVTAATSHLAGSTSPEMLFTTSFMNDWVREHLAGHQPRSQAGFGGTSDAPGLGIEVDAGALGAPLFAVGGR